MHILIISWQDGADSPLEMMVTTSCDVVYHHLSRSEWDEAGQERSRHCLPQTSSTTQPFSPVCPSAVSPLAFFCIFFYIFYIFTSTVSSTSHFLHFFSLTPSPHHCLSLKLQTNCVLFVKSKLRKTLDFLNGARSRAFGLLHTRPWKHNLYTLRVNCQ